MQIYRGMIADIRYVTVDGRGPWLEVMRAEPVVDASGAVCGFQNCGTWEIVHAANYDDHASYRSHSDLLAAGGIVDAP